MASSKRDFLFESNIDAIMGFIDVDMLKNDEKMSSEMDFAFEKNHLQKNLTKFVVKPPNHNQDCLLIKNESIVSMSHVSRRKMHLNLTAISQLMKLWMHC